MATSGQCLGSCRIVPISRGTWSNSRGDEGDDKLSKAEYRQLTFAFAHSPWRMAPPTDLSVGKALVGALKAEGRWRE